MANSWVEGSTEPPLSEDTLSGLIRHNVSLLAGNSAVISDGQTFTFGELDKRSARVALSLLSLGIQKGDRVGILAGNRIEYIDLFLAVGRIGRVAVALNPTEPSEELCRAVAKRACKVVFIAARCGARNLEGHISALLTRSLRNDDSNLEHLIIIDPDQLEDPTITSTAGVETYDEFLNRETSKSANADLVEQEQYVKPPDAVTLQFTSGTTGEPKAAVLTHRGIINNAIQLGSRMQLSPTDTLCCPAALFRTFGIVMGFLTAFARGTCVVLPGEEFDADTTVTSIIDHKCTALLGEFRLFSALLDALKSQNRRIETLHICLAAGAVVPAPLRDAMRKEMGIRDFVIAHGQTEMGPMVFITASDDPKDTKSVGRIMSHQVAKVIDDTGALVSRGDKGELCVSGYGLLQCYYGDESKTKKVLRRDDEGRLWFHTGDEASIDEEGFCYYGGRLDDIITTKNGRKIYPTEIEERLLEHKDIAEASVIPVTIGEGSEAHQVVGAFLKARDTTMPSEKDISDWVEQELGSERVPQHLFWVGDPQVGDDIPKTYNGKQQKRKMSEMASEILKSK